MTNAFAPAGLMVSLVDGAFSTEAAKRAGYALMDRLTISFEDGESGLSLRIVPVQADADLAVLERDFRRELLDQDLRLSLETRTEPIRTAVLGLAFSRTGLQDG